MTEWFSQAALGEYLGVPERSVRLWRARGDGPPAVKFGKFVRYSRTDVDAWIEQQRQKERASA